MVAAVLVPPVTDPIDIFEPRLFFVFYKELGVVNPFESGVSFFLFCDLEMIYCLFIPVYTNSFLSFT